MDELLVLYISGMVNFAETVCLQKHRLFADETRDLDIYQFLIEVVIVITVPQLLFRRVYVHHVSSLLEVTVIPVYISDQPLLISASFMFFYNIKVAEMIMGWSESIHLKHFLYKKFHPNQDSLAVCLSR